MQDMMWWQWHQLDHIQIICTLLQTDNDASTASLSFLQADHLHDAQPIVSKHCPQIRDLHGVEITPIPTDFISLVTRADVRECCPV